MTDLIREIVSVLPDFHAIDPQKVLVSVSENEVRKYSGVLAYVLPLKFRDGLPIERKQIGNQVYHFGLSSFFYEGREILYIINFLIPRFFTQSYIGKLDTVIHELYHISPQFDGDLRRLKGRSSLHGASLKAYDQIISGLRDKFLGLPHNPTKLEFLNWNAKQLARKYGGFHSYHIKSPRPKLLKVSKI